MRGRWWWAVVLVGAVAVLRQRREATRVRHRQLAPLGPDGTVDDAQPAGRVHHRAAAWMPPRPSTRLGRAAGAVWAAPLSAVAVVGGLLGGCRPRWDAGHGVAVVPAVRGPFRWFLQAQSAAAATLGQVVVLRDPTATPRLLRHEAAHARQQERLGPLFAVVYPVATALWGYRRNPFEVAARAAARGEPAPTGREAPAGSGRRPSDPRP